jgi:methionyl-tRNA synthetase
MAISQKGNALLQQCAPWKYLNSEENEEKNKSLSGLALAWRIARSLAVLTRPFMPFQSDRLWKMLGEVTLIDDILWQDAIKFNSKMTWVDTIPAPLFKKLDLNEILQREDTIAKKYNNDNEVTPVARDKESDYIQFEDFLKVEMKTGKILSVTEHPNADKLWIIKLQDSSDSTRTICAGLKDVYEKEKLEGMNVVYVANLEPRKLRGIVSEGMLLAADDGNGNVKLLTPEGEISVGSLVR